MSEERTAFELELGAMPAREVRPIEFRVLGPAGDGGAKPEFVLTGRGTGGEEVRGAVAVRLGRIPSAGKLRHGAIEFPAARPTESGR